MAVALYPIRRYGAAMTLRTLLAAAAPCVALLLPSAAGAAELAPLKPCYLSPPDGTPEAVELRGSGFTPASAVDVYIDGVVADQNVFVDSDGTFGTRGGNVPAPRQPKGERPFTVTAVERGNPVNTAAQSAQVTAFGVDVRPLGGPPRGRAWFTGRGFTGGGPVYAHYSRKHRPRRTVRIATPALPCGTFHVKRSRFPVAKPKPGPWTIQFDQQRAFRAEPPDAVWFALDVPVVRKPR